MSILLVGCGRMGSALARGWRGHEEVAVYDPAAPVLEGVRLLGSLGAAKDLAEPLVVVIAVKPQILGAVLPELRPIAQRGALFVSIAAGARIAGLSRALGGNARLVRAMPNTPAAIGRGITAAIAGPGVEMAERERVGALLRAVGEVVWLDNEEQIDAVTAVSGSGPAYFFRFTEALAKAGRDHGLPEPLAMQLARATFIGAGALAEARTDGLDALRQEVTSPGGTTAAALARFDEQARLDQLVDDAVAAAVRRSRELSQ